MVIKNTGIEKSIKAYPYGRRRYEVRSQLDVTSDNIEKLTLPSTIYYGGLILGFLGGVCGMIGGFILDIAGIKEILSFQTTSIAVGSGVLAMITLVIIAASPREIWGRYTEEETKNHLMVRLYYRDGTGQPATRISEKEYTFELSNEKLGTKYLNSALKEIEKEIKKLEKNRFEPKEQESFHNKLIAGTKNEPVEPEVVEITPVDQEPSGNRFSDLDIGTDME